jgi:hypothetical protein
LSGKAVYQKRRRLLILIPKPEGQPFKTFVSARWQLKRRNGVLETIAVVLILLWILGMVSSYTLGGFIHVLLVVAIVVILIRVIQGRKPL